MKVNLINVDLNLNEMKSSRGTGASAGVTAAVSDIQTSAATGHAAAVDNSREAAKSAKSAHRSAHN